MLSKEDQLLCKRLPVAKEELKQTRGYLSQLEKSGDSISMDSQERIRNSYETKIANLEQEIFTTETRFLQLKEEIRVEIKSLAASIEPLSVQLDELEKLKGLNAISTDDYNAQSNSIKSKLQNFEKSIKKRESEMKMIDFYLEAEGAVDYTKESIMSTINKGKDVLIGITPDKSKIGSLTARIKSTFRLPHWGLKASQKLKIFSVLLLATFILPWIIADKNITGDSFRKDKKVYWSWDFSWSIKQANKQISNLSAQIPSTNYYDNEFILEQIFDNHVGRVLQEIHPDKIVKDIDNLKTQLDKLKMPLTLNPFFFLVMGSIILFVVFYKPLKDWSSFLFLFLVVFIWAVIDWTFLLRINSITSIINPYLKLIPDSMGSDYSVYHSLGSFFATLYGALIFLGLASATLVHKERVFWLYKALIVIGLVNLTRNLLTNLPVFITNDVYKQYNIVEAVFNGLGANLSNGPAKTMLIISVSYLLVLIFLIVWSIVKLLTSKNDFAKKASGKHDNMIYLPAIAITIPLLAILFISMLQESYVLPMVMVYMSLILSVISVWQILFAGYIIGGVNNLLIDQFSRAPKNNQDLFET